MPWSLDGLKVNEIMRKKDILGNFVKNPDVLFTYTIKKVIGKCESYSALIEFLPGCRELRVDNDGERLCLAGAGYKWLMYLPLNEYWCLNVFYNPKNVLLEWYFDISKGNYLDENDMPCIDDIFLDLVILPDGRTITVDDDELQEALDENEITIDDFNHAYKVHEQIKSSKWNNVEFLMRFSDKLLSDYD
jgi:predicted RNA-binding protein associated with RNAse of E/G family